MEKRPVVVGADVNIVEDVPTTIYMTNNNFGDNLKILNSIPPNGSWGADDSNPITNYANLSNIEFWINQQGDDAVYDTNRSCIVLRNKFILNVAACSATNIGADYTLGPKQGSYPVSSSNMGPGKLILKEGAWWYARCKVKYTSSTYSYLYNEFEEPVAIALAPLNACCGLEQT